MLHDVLRHGVLRGHAGRYCVRLSDAMEPERLLGNVAFGGGRVGNPPHGKKQAGNLPHGLRAVFLNHLLDCLPAAVLEFDGERARQLCVRTCVARNVRLAVHTDLTAERLRERASRSRLPGGTSTADVSVSGDARLSAAGEQVPPGRRDLLDQARDDLLEVYGLFASEYDYQPVEARALPYGEFAVAQA